MHSASVEWMARVAARNEIEEAKALRAGTPASTRLVALSAGGSKDGSSITSGQETASPLKEVAK